MKIKIRKGIFETNSSSIHTVCIHKKEDQTVPHCVKLSYNWDYTGQRISSFEDKANYIYNLCALMDINYPVLYTQKNKSYICRFFSFLEVNNVKYEYNTEEDYSYALDGDEELAITLFEDITLLYQLLFDDRSYIIIRDNNFRDDPLPEELDLGIKFKDAFVKFDYDV